jgi:2'-5' RNA ligase
MNIPNATPVIGTAVVIIPPHEVQAVAVPLLQQYAPINLIHVPAHITLMYPFVPLDQLKGAAHTVRQICAVIPPFDVTLDGYDFFPDTAYLKIANPAPIMNVFHRLFAAFPAHPPYEGKFGDVLSPHITVAEWDETQDYGTQPSRPPLNLPPYAPLTFRAERLHIYYGVLEVPLPFIPFDVIPLGKT